MRARVAVLLLCVFALALSGRTARAGEPKVEVARRAETAVDPLAALPSWFARSAASALRPEAGSGTDSQAELARLLAGAEAKISGKVIQQLARQSVDGVFPVDEEMLGLPLTGRARLIGEANVELAESPDRGTFDVLVTGTIVSQTVGDGGRAHIHARTVTRFAARKRILLDEQGLTALPARCNARSKATLLGTTSRLPGLRGRLARRIGRRRAQELLAESEQIAARRAADRICRQLDQQADVQLAEANRLFRDQVRRLAAAEDERGRPAPLKFHTTATHLVVSGLRAKPAASPVPAAIKKLEREVAALIVLPVTAIDATTASGLLVAMAGDGTSIMQAARQALPAEIVRMLDERKIFDTAEYRLQFTVDRGRLVLALRASED